MRITADAEISRDNLPDAPDDEWIDTLIEHENTFNRQTQAVLNQALPYGNSDLMRNKPVRLTHGVAASVTVPLGRGIYPQAIIPVACVGVTLDATGQETNATYDLAVPQIQWKLAPPLPSGELQVYVTAYYPAPLSGSGSQGEEIKSVVLSGAAIGGWVTNVPQTITSLPLTPGTWDMNVISVISGTLTGTAVAAAISGSAASMPAGAVSTGDRLVNMPTMPTATADVCMTISQYRESFTTTTTRFYNARITYTAGTPAVYGRFSAVRAFPYLTGTRGKVMLLFVGG